MLFTSSKYTIFVLLNLVKKKNKKKKNKHFFTCLQLTALVSALMGKLWCQRPDPSFLLVLSTFGPIAAFEGLLSLHGHELDMWGDMVVAVEDLSTVTFTLVHSTSTSSSSSSSNSRKNRGPSSTDRYIRTLHLCRQLTFVYVFVCKCIHVCVIMFVLCFIVGLEQLLLLYLELWAQELL